MRSLSEAFNQSYYGDSKEPHYVVEIAYDSDATDLVYFTSHASTATPVGETVFSGVIKKISSTSQKIEPEQGRSTIGSISVELVDLAGALTTHFKSKDIADIGLRQRRVRVFQGFVGMSWSDISSNPIQTQIVDSLDQEKGYYRLRCADIQRVTRKEIFKPVKTRLTQSVDSSQLLLPVLSIDSIQLVAHGSSYTDAPDQSVFYARIEDEVVRCTGTVVDPHLGNCYVADKRGALNTLPAAHEVDAADTDDRGQEVVEFFYLELPAVKLAYALLTGELLGQEGESLPLNWHAGVDPQFVRQSDFENIGSDLYDASNDSGLILRFAGEEAQDGKRFIETQICLLAGCFMPVYATGELGLKRFSNVLYESPYVMEINEDNIVSHGQLIVDMRSIRNLLSVSWNYDFIREKLTRQKILVDDVSRFKHKDAPAKAISFRGLHGSRHTSATLEGLFDRLRDRYSGPPLRLKVSCLPKTSLLEVGDVVRVKLSTISDYQIGSDIDRSMEVQSIAVNWDDGSVSLELLGSSEGATPISSTSGGLGSVLSDAWYVSEGTDLASYPGVTVTDIGGVGHITAGTIVGGATLEEGIYYYDGDLELDAGVDLFIEDNVQLRVKGFFQINGSINGVAAGLPGGASPSAGFLGTTYPMGGMTYAIINFFGGYLTPIIHHSNNVAPGVGENQTVPVLNFSVVDGALSGLPDRLTGTSGGRGGSAYGVGDLTLENAGGNGGAGGAGLLLVCRGSAFGVAGSVDLSGGPGALGSSIFWPQGLIELNGGTGAGGAPGAFVVALDGATSTIPDLTKYVGQYGAMPFDGDAIFASNPGNYDLPVQTGGNVYSYFTGYALSRPDLSGFNGGSRVQFIAPELDVIEDEPSILDGFYELPVLANITLVSGTATLLPAIDGSYRERIQATWNVAVDPYVNGYEVQARAVGGSWQTVQVIVDVDAPLVFIPVTEGVTYQVRVRSYSNRTTVRPSPWLQAPDHLAQGKSVPPVDPTGFSVAINDPNGAIFNVDDHPDIDFRRFLFYQGDVFATATFLFDASSVKSYAGPVSTAGSFIFWVVAEDRTGNLSSPVSVTATYSNPADPVPSLSYAGPDAVLQWPVPASSFVIDYYEISINAVVVAESKSTSFRTRVTWTGSDTISIVAVDIAGNRSGSVDVVVNPAKPAKPVLQALKTAANQFKLIYTATAGALPIDAYIVSVGSLTTPTEVLEKAGASSFTTISEEAAGDYEYFVQARDTAGNISAAASITVKLEASTDLNLILADSQAASAFAGTRTNILDYQGDLLLPIPDGRVWQDKYSSYASLQAKIDDGYPQFLQPASATATYVYTADVGAIIASATIQVTTSLEAVVGTVGASIGIETSDDDISYSSISVSNGAGQGIDFRYVRVTVTFTPVADTDYAKLLEVALNVLTIAREESGTFTSTMTAGGDTVALSQPFADIQSIIATANNFDQIESSFDWTDPNPTEFKAQIFVAGTVVRYTGQVGYTVRGI